MRFPKRITFRRAKAVIYGRSGRYGSYRVAWHPPTGGRQMRAFPTYSAALAFAEETVRGVANRSPATTLTAAQARDALAAVDRLDAHHHAGHPRPSLLLAVSEFCESQARLGDAYTVREAIDAFLRTAAKIERVVLSEAVEQYLALRRSQTQSKDGGRPPRAAKYIGSLATWLRQLATALPGHAVCDLTKAHLDAFFAAPALTCLSAKARNDRRATFAMFLRWAVKKDWLPATHRLFEADGMSREQVEHPPPDFYRPAELASLLADAEPVQRPVIALGGLAGLRTEEILRLTWADVWRVPGHVEIPARVAKGRARRLVEVGPALAAWLAPFRDELGSVWRASRDTWHANFSRLHEQTRVVRRPNGLRHAYATYSYALSGNENLVAAAMGNSPAMIHAHYKGLATKAEAEAWFNTFPAPPAANVVPLSTVAHS